MLLNQWISRWCRAQFGVGHRGLPPRGNQMPLPPSTPAVHPICPAALHQCFPPTEEECSGRRLRRTMACFPCSLATAGAVQGWTEHCPSSGGREGGCQKQNIIRTGSMILVLQIWPLLLPNVGIIDYCVGQESHCLSLTANAGRCRMGPNHPVEGLSPEPTSPQLWRDSEPIN